MFQLLKQYARHTGAPQRRILPYYSIHETSIYQLQSQQFSSIFGGIFNKKKEEEQAKAAESKKEQKEPTMYHKESRQEVQAAE